MIPPLMSSTMKMEDLKTGGNSNQPQANKTQGNTGGQKSGEEKKAGRPEKEDAQKSEKTIQNKESMS